MCPKTAALADSIETETAYSVVRRSRTIEVTMYVLLLLLSPVGESVPNTKLCCHHCCQLLTPW